MPDFTHNNVEYQISLHHGQVGDLVDNNGEPVVMYYSRVRVKPPAGQPEGNTGWVLVMDGNQTAIARNADDALLQAQTYIQQQA